MITCTPLLQHGSSLQKVLQRSCQGHTEPPTYPLSCTIYCLFETELSTHSYYAAPFDLLPSARKLLVCLLLRAAYKYSATILAACDLLSKSSLGIRYAIWSSEGRWLITKGEIAEYRWLLQFTMRSLAELSLEMRNSMGQFIGQTSFGRHRWGKQNTARR